MIFQDPVPLLWVVPPDLIEGVSSEALVTSISRLDNIQVWQLDGGAVAFSLPDILVKMGVPLDYGGFLRRTRPLFQNVDHFTILNHDALDLQIPDKKFWVRMTLKPEETNRRSCMHLKSHLRELAPFAFKAYSVYGLSKGDSENLKAYLTDWLLSGNARPINGETLHVGKVEMKAYQMGGSERFYPECGYEIRCSDYIPCTWPWVDLYLRMRRDLPTKKRLSIRFFNRIDPREDS